MKTLSLLKETLIKSPMNRIAGKIAMIARRATKVVARTTMPRSATSRARDLAVPRNCASLRFAATTTGTGFAGGLLRCARCEGDQPFASSHALHPIPQNQVCGHAGLNQRFLNLILALSMAAVPAAYAQQTGAQQSAALQPGSIELKNVAEIEVKTTDAKGKVSLKRTPADKAIPGTEVIYTTTFKNIGDKPVGDIVINNPLPLHTTLVAGSVFGTNTDITYSIDGKNFAAPEKIKVKGKDGKEVPATAADYTHIRWSLKGNLAAGKSDQVGFRAKIN